MKKLQYIDRLTNQRVAESVCYEKTMTFLYTSRLGKWVPTLLSRSPFLSRLYGWIQKRSWTRKKIPGFIKRNHICAKEFKKSIAEFSSFNDFFTRELRPEARPVAQGNNICVTPVDGAYLIYPNVSEFGEFVVKSKRFSLSKLLGDPKLVEKYASGSVVFARLALFDYHRFHFPVDCLAGPTHNINGYLFSVHPMALKDNFNVFCENKRTLTELKTEAFGDVLYLEVGALNVGSIIQTYIPGEKYSKGDEKGFFEIGGSTVIVLFEPGFVQFDADLLKNSRMGLETRCLMGQSLGCSLRE
ncbi:Phosphatidylserine decarboxylase proenzyme,phosphatidylserine decarboxylase,Na /alanine symporter,phosphatidylserine decarboxylase,Phosphatidylserine decarboxylase [Chlamydia poikilotherma]|uniref:Phosphatidylserine decarboxylase proenzyme n=1 Tax=Chlamydia poikilotherma TaxID=1967783 RepID=A0A3B0PX24_9CHLA|nr:phosphatidylserine decarboxylase [Chlamydia poikilotherma]SYX09386.1 Phosphatidylserine decarboxylase proenzyme,phosphatidylserine decarboxylase,Na /alanine symporter,phosphatidylserine decarboxylase,Phosphatidylserine decarboxylase [Chlamydia poikilotherma]